MSQEWEARAPDHVDGVASYYDVWTDEYLRDFGHTLQAHRPTLEMDLHAYLLRSINVPLGGRALDAGCGVCGPAAYFARAAQARIDALTISPKQAERARAYVESQGVSEQVAVQVGDFHHLGDLYPGDCFDVVYFLESMSHAADMSQVIDGAYQVLKPGGAIYIKDFFVRPVPTDEARARIAKVIAKVDRLFAVKTPRAQDLFAALWDRGFLPELIRPLGFTVDNGVWQRFDARHSFDLFDGGESFDWSQWLELRFVKP